MVAEPGKKEMKIRKLTYQFFLAASCLLTSFVEAQQAVKNATDPVAENMLVYQRSIGGWPKHINEVKVDYEKTLTDADKTKTIADRNRKDATIDNGATTKEIRYLLKTYKTTSNKSYLEAAENGISYLLRMQ